MKNNETTEDRKKWHSQLWAYTFSLIPFKVQVNLTTGVYNVMDKNGNYVYADDLTEKEYEIIIEEWGEILNENSLKDYFSISTINSSIRNNKTEQMVQVPMASGMAAYEFIQIRLTLSKVKDNLALQFEFIPACN